MKKLIVALFVVIACCNYSCAQLSKSVEVKKAGTLSELLTDEEKKQVEELTVSGKLNSSDVKLLRRMAGAKDADKEFDWQGKLKKLDLGKASFVDDDTPFFKIRARDSYTFTRKISDQVRARNRKTGETKMVNRDDAVELMKNSKSGKSKLLAMEMEMKPKKPGKYEYTLGEIRESEWEEILALNWNVWPDQYIEREVSDSVRYYIYCHTAMNYISPYMFYECDNLESVILSNDTERIALYALSNCSNLKSIEIPRGVISIHKGAFRHLPELTTLRISNKSENKYLKQSDMVIKANFFGKAPNLTIERY